MSDGAALILVIEDDLQVRRFLRASLSAHGYKMIESESGEEGVKLAAIHQPNLILLDLGLTDMDGLDVIRQLREWSSIPIMVVSARVREGSKVLALDAGADDYLTKPFGVDELLARIRVILRHVERSTQIALGQESPVLLTGDLRIDLARQQVFVGDQEVHLTSTEYRLLKVLAQNAGRVITHQQLLTHVWGVSYINESHYLRVYMAQLRRKLEINTAHPRYILTEPGVGYRLAMLS